jgi:CxxC-x17-CxxC domain-containing protein
LYSDKNLSCVDCSQEFVFTARDQEFYAGRGFSEPRRCPSCRAAKKAQRDTGGDQGSYSSSGSYSSGGYGGGGGGGYGGSRDRGPRQMFTATCSQCGNEASLPFRPTNGKPVYCSDCFRSMRGG